MSWEAAYAAGFFDGEGCITAQVAKDGSTRLHVRIGQKFVDPLEFVQLHFGGKLSQCKDGMFYIEWSGRSALPVIEAMLPYLIVKRRQAELAVEWCSLGYVNGTSTAAAKLGQKRMSEENRTRRIEIVRELKTAKAVILWVRGISTLMFLRNSSMNGIFMSPLPLSGCHVLVAVNR